MLHSTGDWFCDGLKCSGINIEGGEISYLYRVRNLLTICFLFYKNSDFPVFVMKHATSKEGRMFIEQEYRNMIAIRNLVPNDLKKCIPEPICLLKDKKHVGLIMEGMPGSSLGSLLHDHLRRSLLASVELVCNWLFRFQTETIVKAKEPNDKAVNFIKKAILQFINKYNLSPEEKSNLLAKTDQITNFLQKDSYVTAYHGDLWPSNILVHNDDISVVDWAFMGTQFYSFWDFYTFFSSLQVILANNDTKYIREMNRIKEHYLKKIGIDEYYERMLYPIFFAIKSVWTKVSIGTENPWDDQWKTRYDKFLSQ